MGINLNRSVDRLILSGIVYRRIVFSGQNVRRPCFVTIPNRFRPISMAVAGTMAAIAPRRRDFELDLFGDQNGENRESRVSCNYEKLDGWVRESVTEIVKNLRKAPLFVNVYSDGGVGTRLETEAAVAEEWPKWEKSPSPAPDGVIFVEELRSDGEEEDSPTKAWGVVVQGRGSDCPPACYLLKTSSNRGMGVCCTHFCLVKVTSFRETASSQLKNCWLMPPLH